MSTHASSQSRAALALCLILEAHDFEQAAHCSDWQHEQRFFTNAARRSRAEAQRSLARQHHIIWC